MSMCLALKLLIEDSIFTFSTGDGSLILRGHNHPSHAKVYGLCISKEEPLIVTFNSQLFQSGSLLRFFKCLASNFQPWRITITHDIFEISMLHVKLAIASLIFSYVFEDWKVSLATQRCHGKLLLFGIFRGIKTLKNNRLKVWILYIMGSTLAVWPSLVDFYESLFEYSVSVFGLFKHLNQSLKKKQLSNMDTNFSPIS